MACGELVISAPSLLMLHLGVVEANQESLRLEITWRCRSGLRSWETPWGIGE